MLADLVDHVIGVDPAKRVFMAVLVDASTKAEIAHREFKTAPSGYSAAIEWADEHATTADQRVWAVEGTGSYGSGLFQVLDRAGEWVIEFGHPKKPASLDGTKTDRLDAARAGREALGFKKWAQPRARGTREGLRCLLCARAGAQKARTQAVNEFKALVISAPVELRETLTGSSTAELISCGARFRVPASAAGELVGTKIAMRSVARRVQALTKEAAELETAMRPLVEAFAPQLLAEFGVGTVCAARVIVAWSHRGRFASDAAFCRLAGVAPIVATSGGAEVIKHRLNPGGDRTLNKALHTVMLVRVAHDPETKAFIARKRAEGKSGRDARRCVKRYIARHLYRLLENPPETD
jgi:transposase